MPKIPTYSPNRTDRAIREIQCDVASVRAISKKYIVPRATFQFKLKNPGHKSQWIIELAKKGFPWKKRDITSSVQQFLKTHPRPNPFNNDKSGDGWLKAFLKRHPEIVERTTEAVTSASARVSENDIQNWIKDIEKYVMEKNLSDVIQDPSRMFNGEETGFQICTQSGNFLAPKGYKNIYTVDRGSSKENITVMFTLSADGN
ncbi:hypothetical protein HUJ05_001911 [Dendroctonus ponderosae]|nr:hypothetical protein HUJ05_001911 [Dendroctonus ponderosae]